jgi:hypothetical protein
MGFAALYPSYEKHTFTFPRRVSPGACKSFRPNKRIALPVRLAPDHIHRKNALGQPGCIFRLGGPCSLIRNSARFAGAKV